MKSVSYDFTGSTALVTGASKGIGREIALRLAASGSNVAATARNESELAQLSEEVSEYDVEVDVFPCDLAVTEQINRMCDHFKERFEFIDLVVNSAGTTFPETVLETTDEHWDRTINVNLKSVLSVVKYMAPPMIERGGGAIVNVGSLAGEVAIEEHASYCASKFGLHGLSKVMALELGPHGIRTNCVAPTVVLTPMGLKVWGDPEKADKMKQKIPLRRFLDPSEVADAVLFLLSDSAATVNGEIMMLDGGYSIR